MNKDTQNTKKHINTSEKSKKTSSRSQNSISEKYPSKTSLNKTSIDDTLFINEKENRLAILIAKNEFIDDEYIHDSDNKSPFDSHITNSADVTQDSSNPPYASSPISSSPISSSPPTPSAPSSATSSPAAATSSPAATTSSPTPSAVTAPVPSPHTPEKANKYAEKNVSYLNEEYNPCDPAFANNEFFHPADRADQLESLSLEKQLCLLAHMDTEDAAETIAELDGTAARDLIENLDAEDAAKILSAMDPDDAVDVLDDVEEGHRDVLLSNLAPEEAMELRTLLSFDPDTAAGVMNTEIIIISQDESVDDAIHHIRLELEDKDMPYYVYAVDEYDKLVGIISLRELMLSKPRTFIKELLSERRSLITAQYDLDKAEVARILSHYNFLALPVVDKEGHLMGAVTHDDVIDIIQENASSDLLGMVGAGQDEDIYTPWTKSVKLRLPWLFINMLNSSASAYIVYLFEGSIAQMAFLAVLMPMIANQAGNTGQQALAVMIRQLATEKFDNKKSWKAVFRESKIGLTTGIIMAILSTGIVWTITSNPILGCIMGASLMLDMVLGSIAGGSIPLILRALGRDPAQASSIFLTAITDGAGFFIFLSLATIFVL